MSVKVSRILHAGYLFESENTKILFDPIFENPFSVNCYAYPQIEFEPDKIKAMQFDAVIISHYHDDHFSLQSLHLLNKNTPIYMFSFFDEHFTLLRSLGFSAVYAIQWMRPIRIGNFEVIPLRAVDEDIDSIFHIKAGGINILNLVDSWIAPSTMDYLQSIETWDLLLWPFQTMRELEVLNAKLPPSEPTEIPPEWIEQISLLNPKTLVPSSCQFRFEDWSYYNQNFFPMSYELFSKRISELLPTIQVQRINPGESYLINETGFFSDSPLDWVRPLGPQNVDYSFLPSSQFPPVSEIAKRFPTLSESQKQDVLIFLTSGLKQRWAELETPPDSFFYRPRSWELSIYSENGTASRYNYAVNQNTLEQSLNNDRSQGADWKTEISEYKLYCALKEGESLTSIYVRISSAPQEDLLEDPLLRLLYEGKVASYQKAQLHRLTLEKSKL